MAEPVTVNARHFLAYKRGLHPPRDGRGEMDKPTLEVGVVYDTALEIDERNGWLEVGELDSEMIQTLVSTASRGLSELIMFCFHGQVLDRRGKGMRTAFRRFLSVAWMLHSEKLCDKKGKPLSLFKLGKLPQIDCTRCTLSLLAQEFGARWGFRVRVQKRVTSKPNYAHAARKGWKKRRRRIRDEKRRASKKRR